jgi:hypothetical protein
MLKHVSKIVDTRLAAHSNETINYVAEQGSMNTVYLKVQSTSSSTNSTNFNLNNIAQYTCRDSRLAVSGVITLSLTLTNSTGAAINAIQADNFGAKSYFYNRAVNSITHQINQATENYNNNQILDSISRLSSDSENVNFYDNHQPDLTDTFSAATGTNINPLASYSSTIQGDGVFKPRTLDYTIVSGNSIPANASGTVVISIKLYEPLVSPFTNIGKKNSEGLYAINGETINITYVSDLFNNMFCYYAPTGLATPVGVVSFGTTLTLNCIYLTPHAEMIPQIPKQSVYHFNYFQTFTSAIGAFPASGSTGAIQTVSSQTISITNVPSKILIYARLADGSRLASIPDKYLSITGAQVSFDNGQNVLQGASEDQLYDISVRNRLVMPRPCFKQQALNTSISPPALFGCGSVLVLDPALDCGLRPDITTGSPGRYIFQVQNLQVENKTGVAFDNVVLFVVCVSNAILERNGSEYRSYLLSMDDALFKQAKHLPAVSHELYNSQKSDNLFLSGGGKFGDLFKKALGVAKSGITSGLNYLQANPDVAKAGLQVGRQLTGLGGAHPLPVNPRRNMDLFFE